AGRLYGGHHNQLIGVTGTNGKTTITQLIAQWLELLGHKAAVMGTTGNGFLNALEPAANTTGNALQIQATLRDLAERGAQYTALETSSHGLV
ncbi:UDP-N-acetylmuramoyl-L-alanyl-D-glutamate--2,6-diaminopimelate ligase, partial [Vibrio cholerae]